MSQYDPQTTGDQYAAGASIAAEATSDARSTFLKKTYMHLFGAVLVFMIIESLLMQLESVRDIAITMTTGWNWLIVMAVFIFGSMGAERMARNAVSLGSQYLALGLYIVLWSVVFIPVMYIATVFQKETGQPLLAVAGGSTIGIFGVLTAIVLLTKKDFSFMRSAIYMLTFIAMGLIVCGIIFGFELGPIFCVAMVGLTSLWVLYHTSNVLHHYQTNQYVSASLALFGALAMLFWYVLRIAMYFMGDD